MDNIDAYLFLFNDSLFTSLMFIPRLSYAGDVMIAIGGYNPYIVFIISYIASLIGLSLNWIFGLYIRKLENTKKLSHRKTTFEKAEIAFNRKYKWILLLSFIPFWGPLFTTAAGTLRYRFSHFIILVSFSKFVGLSYNIFFS